MSRKDTVLLFLFVLTSSSTVFGDRLLDISLLTWGELQTQAGYFTKSGRWKGGLPKKVRKEAELFGSCEERQVNGTFCQSWTSEEERKDSYGKGNCKCSKNTGAYCQEWTCLREHTKRTCEKRYKKRCIATPKEMHVQSCICLEAADSGAYCVKWKCSEERRRRRYKDGVFTCRASDASMEFCHLWNGDFESDKEVESIACECTDSGDGYCDYWQCQARTLLRCSKHKGGWCRLGVSLGVFGSLGLLFLSGGMAIIFDDVLKGKTAAWNRGKILAIYVCFLVLPWGIGVAIAGGIDGIAWVTLMWSIPFLILAFVLFQSKRGKAAEPSSMLAPLQEPPQIPAYLFDGKTYAAS